MKWISLACFRRLLAPTTLEADSRAGARCEARFGAGRRFPIFLYVTIGTGISCSLVVDGHPFLGAGLDRNDGVRPHGNTLLGVRQAFNIDLEEISSGPAIASRFNQRSGAVVVRIGGRSCCGEHG